MATSATQSRFTAAVRTKLADNKTAGQKPDSIRSLAKVMGRGSEARAATYRRSLFKWLAEGEPNPSPESRALVADALGLEPQELADDDEESDLPHKLLERAMRIIARQEIARAETGSAAPALVAVITAALVVAGLIG